MKEEERKKIELLEKIYNATLTITALQTLNLITYVVIAI